MSSLDETVKLNLYLHTWPIRDGELEHSCSSVYYRKSTTELYNTDQRNPFAVPDAERIHYSDANSHPAIHSTGQKGMKEVSDKVLERWTRDSVHVFCGLAQRKIQMRWSDMR